MRSSPLPNARPAAADVAQLRSRITDDNTRAADNDPSRLVATDPAGNRGEEQGSAVTRALEKLEGENAFLREQITTKDRQINALLERDRETNILVRGLQEMLTPLLGHRQDEPRYQDKRNAS